MAMWFNCPGLGGQCSFGLVDVVQAVCRIEKTILKVRYVCMYVGRCIGK